MDNTNKRFVVGRSDLILLIKKQKDKEYCTLYIADCESKFWLKKIDVGFLEELKERMSINTDLLVFSRHFVKNLKEKSKLRVDNGEMVVEIELVIGEGLVMTCSFEVENCINSEEAPNDYKIIMKLFLKQLFDAKDAQIDEERRKWQRIKQEEEDKRYQNHEKVDPTYVKEVLHGNLKKNDAIDPKIKNRSLMNPNHKKRKAGRIKFAGEEEG